MGQVLYRKYRSLGFDEVIGQEHVTKTLEQALKKGTVAHAYLFTGPRGVGKTSVARIMAYGANKIDYTPDQTHLDIIEIDAASNRRIDEIRDLREKVHIAPVSAKYKVYIIDEVHMLTNEAFNALLKTLEEPPAHVIFILATTEAHKVPETITSRTQRFAFRPIDAAKMVEHLLNIAKKEKIKITQGAATLIAEHARGSFRDGLSLLDQLKAHSESIDEATVEHLLGLPSHQHILEIIDGFTSGSTKQVFDSLDRLGNDGVTPEAVSRALSKRLRDLVLENSSSADKYLPLIERLLSVDASYDPLLQLETALLLSMQISDAKAVVRENVPTPKKTPKSSEKVSKSKKFDWNSVLAATRENSESLHALLRTAQHEYDDQAHTLRLRFRFAFHAKRLQDQQSRRSLEQILSPFFATLPEVIIEQDETVGNPVQTSGLDQVASLLGGEVVEL